MWRVVLIAEKGMYRGPGVRPFEKSAHLLVFSPVIKDVSPVIQTDLSCTPLIIEALRLLVPFSVYVCIPGVVGVGVVGVLIWMRAMISRFGFK